MSHDPSETPVVSHADHTSMGIEKEHPTWSTYWKVAVILTLITVVEVWIYYIPSFVASRLFVPALLIMAAVKFAIVVLFYMHLRYDHKLFRVLFLDAHRRMIGVRDDGCIVGIVCHCRPYLIR